MQSFILDRHTDPSNPTMKVTQDDKIPIYDSKAAAEADIANIEEGGIVATKDTGATEKVVDVVQDGNMNPVTSNAVYDFVNDPHNKVSFYYNADTAHSTATDYKNGLLSALNSFHIPDVANPYIFVVRFEGGYYAFYDVMITGLPGLAKITVADESSHEGDRFTFSYNGTHWVA